MNIGIVIVAFNAEATISQVLARIPTDFAVQVKAIIICDDASEDSTYARAMECKEEFPHLPIHVRRQPTNRGYGGNQKTGYEWAGELGMDVVVLLHADAQYSPDELPHLVQPILAGEADAVLGSRMLPKGGARRGGMPLYKFAGNKILSRSQNALAGTTLSEWHSGYRAYSMSALERLDIRSNSNGFDFDTQIILQLLASGARVSEVPITTYYGDEISHVNGTTYAFQVIRETVRFRFNKMGLGTGRYAPTRNTYPLKDFPDSSHTAILQLLSARRGLRVLDLGSADGALGARIQQLGHTVIGVDVSTDARSADVAFEVISADLNRGLPAELRGTFDVVLCADVLEHLPKPEHILSQSREMLSDNGELIVSIPNFGHWYPRVRSLLGKFDYDQRGILDIGHLRFFTQRSFERLATRTGYEAKRAASCGTPIQMLLTTDGRLTRMVVTLLRKIEKVLVVARPQVFAYQFIYRLKPAGKWSSGDNRQEHT